MITVENLTYTYPGTAVPAVQHLSFAVEPGEILGFLGPSGAGKSTTQKVLSHHSKIS
ncbi:MAG: ATP-binding cassette domain-containing protein [Anaerolinea sp.]|nr:ATP-binding cassette domain-containing protein [Anaerolinea sp.]